MEKLVSDIVILKLALRSLSLAFDHFISETLDENGKPKIPDIRAISKARGYLPEYCVNSYRRK